MTNLRVTSWTLLYSHLSSMAWNTVLLEPVIEDVWTATSCSQVRNATTVWLPPVLWGGREAFGCWSSFCSTCKEPHRLHWTGHALRSNDTVLKEVLKFKPDEWHRGRGRPRLRFYDTVKTDLLERDVSISARNSLDYGKPSSKWLQTEKPRRKL